MRAFSRVPQTSCDQAISDIIVVFKAKTPAGRSTILFQLSFFPAWVGSALDCCGDACFSSSSTRGPKDNEVRHGRQSSVSGVKAGRGPLLVAEYAKCKAELS